VAHALGLRNLYGIDIEPSAVKDAEKNAKKNGVRASFICGDLDKDYHDQADLIFANLTVDPLKMLLPVIGKKLAPKGKLIISGIIDDRYQEIMPYIEADWSIDREVIDGSWHTFMLSAK
jgi:ribosomal protein L11 methyltransferase